MLGARIDNPGSTADCPTGSWRSGKKPVYFKANCIHCLTCFNFCPDQCWQLQNDKIVGVDLTYCKGCGVCARECPAPTKAIEMKDENDA